MDSDLYSFNVEALDVIKVHAVGRNCEKCSLKTEVLDDNSKFLIYFSRFLSFVLYMAIPMDRDVYSFNV